MGVVLYSGGNTGVLIEYNSDSYSSLGAGAQSAGALFLGQGCTTAVHCSETWVNCQVGNTFQIVEKI